MALVLASLEAGLKAAANLGMAGASQEDCIAAMAKAVDDHIKTATVTTTVSTVTACGAGPGTGAGTGGGTLS